MNQPTSQDLLKVIEELQQTVIKLDSRVRKLEEHRRDQERTARRYRF